MKRALQFVGCTLLWLAALAVGSLESCCLWIWHHRAVYIAQWGVSENPYAAEEMSLARSFAFLGALPALLLMLLAYAYTWRFLHPRRRRRRRPLQEKE